MWNVWTFKIYCKLTEFTVSNTFLTKTKIYRRRMAPCLSYSATPGYCREVIAWSVLMTWTTLTVARGTLMPAVYLTVTVEFVNVILFSGFIYFGGVDQVDSMYLQSCLCWQRCCLCTVLVHCMHSCAHNSELATHSYDVDYVYVVIIIQMIWAMMTIAYVANSWS